MKAAPQWKKKKTLGRRREEEDSQLLHSAAAAAASKGETTFAALSLFEKGGISSLFMAVYVRVCVTMMFLHFGLASSNSRRFVMQNQILFLSEAIH